MITERKSFCFFPVCSFTLRHGWWYRHLSTLAKVCCQWTYTVPFQIEGAEVGKSKEIGTELPDLCNLLHWLLALPTHSHIWEEWKDWLIISLLHFTLWFHSLLPPSLPSLLALFLAGLSWLKFNRQLFLHQLASVEKRLGLHWPPSTKKASKGSKPVDGFHGASQPWGRGDNFISETL